MLVALRAAFLLIDAHASVPQWDASLPKRLNLGRFQWFASHCGSLHRLTGLPGRPLRQVGIGAGGQGSTVKNWQALYLDLYNLWMSVARRAAFLLIDAHASFPLWDACPDERPMVGPIPEFSTQSWDIGPPLPPGARLGAELDVEPEADPDVKPDVEPAPSLTPILTSIPTLRLTASSTPALT